MCRALVLLCALIDVSPFLPGDARHQRCSSYWCSLDQRQRGRKLLLLLRRLSQVCCLSEAPHANHPSQTHQIKHLRPQDLLGGFNAWFTIIFFTFCCFDSLYQKCPTPVLNWIMIFCRFLIVSHSFHISYMCKTQGSWAKSGPPKLLMSSSRFQRDT